MRFLARLPFLRRRQRDFDEEVESHLALEAERLVRQGMAPAMAQDAAFGSR
jgi:hypothetical protein